jgi:hypothetical protein
MWATKGTGMVANHIHDALAQIRTLQQFLIERNIFKGYSGTARIVSGAVALAGAVAMAGNWFPSNPWFHLAGWTAVLTVGLAANYGALLCWFLSSREAARNPLALSPALDAIPALAVGAALSLALVIHGQFDLLFGTWMTLYGVAQMAYRNSLPRGVYEIGVFYIVCGAACLLTPGVQFTSPMPMGLVFFAGETAGGIILIRDHRRGGRPETVP